MKRIANIERLRILAAFGIVWFHMEGVGGRNIGYAGLPVFLLLFYAFIVMKQECQGLSIFIKNKAKRLLLPWLFWSIMYLVFGVLKSYVKTNSCENAISVYMFLMGASIHLWFLPYAFILSIMVYIFQRLICKTTQSMIIFLSVLVGIVLLVACSVLMAECADMPMPLGQWVFGFSALPLGIAIGEIAMLRDRKKQKCVLTFASLLTITVCVFMRINEYNSVSLQYGIAFLFVSAAFLWHGNMDQISKKIAQLTFGIYLIHPMVSSCLKIFDIQQLHPWLFLACVFIVSALVTLILKKTFLICYV